MYPIKTTHQLKAARQKPQLTEGTTLLGQYESTGLTEPRYLVRRSDGQIVLLTALLYMIVTGLSREESLEVIATDVANFLGQPVSVVTISEVIDLKLTPLGIIRIPGEYEPVLTRRADPLLALTLKGVLLPAKAVRWISRAFRPLHWLLIVFLWIEAFIVADVYIFFVHGVSSSFTAVLTKPISFLPVIGLVLLGTLWHEIGHATACKYGGGEPGRIGFGVYLIFPAFYTDVTDTYRLERHARIRTDLGGVYFNAIFVAIATGVFYLTSYLPIIPVVFLINLAMVQQMLPVVRLDGYYVLSDLVGVPDLFARIKPSTLLPGSMRRGADQLRPAARRIVRTWITITVPVLIVSFGWFLWRIPQLIHNSNNSFRLQWTLANLGYHTHHYDIAALAAFSILLLCIPVLGVLALLARIIKRLIPKKGKHMRRAG